MKDGGPAFPMKEIVCDDGEPVLVTQCYPGMSLRDYFAAKAMQGMLSSWYSVGDNYEHNGLVSEKIISKESYKIADAMLKARELKEVQP
jgi:hypothetical protein